MKRLTSTILLVFSLVLATNAQDLTDDVDFYQALFGMEKTAVVGSFIQLEDGDEATQTFWNLYDAYETERQAQGKKRFALLKKYAENYDSLDDAGTEELMKEMMALGKAYDKNIQSYYKKIKKQCGIKPAAQFYQLEAYFQSAIRKFIFENIPVIGELDQQ